LPYRIRCLLKALKTGGLVCERVLSSVIKLHEVR
jgi:hypothetical protein